MWSDLDIKKKKFESVLPNMITVVHFDTRRTEAVLTLLWERMAVLEARNGTNGSNLKTS